MQTITFNVKLEIEHVKANPSLLFLYPDTVDRSYCDPLTVEMRKHKNTAPISVAWNSTEDGLFKDDRFWDIKDAIDRDMHEATKKGKALYKHTTAVVCQEILQSFDMRQVGDECVVVWLYLEQKLNDPEALISYIDLTKITRSGNVQERK